MFDRILTC